MPRRVLCMRVDPASIPDSSKQVLGADAEFLPIAPQSEQELAGMFEDGDVLYVTPDPLLAAAFKAGVPIVFITPDGELRRMNNVHVVSEPYAGA